MAYIDVDDPMEVEYESPKIVNVPMEVEYESPKIANVVKKSPKKKKTRKVRFGPNTVKLISPRDTPNARGTKRKSRKKRKYRKKRKTKHRR